MKISICQIFFTGLLLVSSLTRAATQFNNGDWACRFEEESATWWDLKNDSADNAISISESRQAHRGQAFQSIENTLSNGISYAQCKLDGPERNREYQLSFWYTSTGDKKSKLTFYLKTMHNQTKKQDYLKNLTLPEAKNWKNMSFSFTAPPDAADKEETAQVAKARVSDEDKRRWAETCERLYPAYRETNEALLALYEELTQAATREEKQKVREAIFQALPRAPVSEESIAYFSLRNTDREAIRKFSTGFAGNSSFKRFLQEVRPLGQPLGKFVPVFTWDGPLRDGVDPLTYYRECYSRGFLPLVVIANPAAVTLELENIQALQQLGYPVALLGFTWFNPNSRKAVSESSHPGCYGMWKREIELEKPRLAAIFEELKKNNIRPDFIFIDWESGVRATFPEKAEKLKLEGYPEAVKCEMCRKNIEAQYLTSPDEYIRGMELYRVKIAREVLIEPCRAINPQIILGSYFAVSHVRNDQPLPARLSRAVGWYQAGWSCSQPVLYPLFLTYQRVERCTVGWNVFKALLERQSELVSGQAPGEYQVPWTSSWMYYPNPPEKDYVPVHDYYLNLKDNKTYQVFPRWAYEELLRHSYLRGARHQMLFIEPSLYGQIYQGKCVMNLELDSQRQVLEEMLPHYDVIYQGRPLNSGPLPAELWDLNRAVVWSGAATEKKTVIRTISFSYRNEKIKVPVFGETRELDAPPQGKTWVFTR